MALMIIGPIFFVPKNFFFAQNHLKHRENLFRGRFIFEEGGSRGGRGGSGGLVRWYGQNRPLFCSKSSGASKE